MSFTKKDQLISRINDNYMDFKASLRGVSRDELFKMAGRISAVTEAFTMLTTDYAWDEQEEVDFFLFFRDPLTIVADAWELRRSEMMVDFDDALFELSDSDTIISQYPLIEGVCRDIVYIGEPEHGIRAYSEI